MAKHKYIKTPEKMWQLFQAYRKNVKDNPRIKVEYVGKEGLRVNTPIERPLSIEGFKCYCAEKIGSIQAYWINRDEQYNEFSPIIARIREEIRNEQIEGGMTGFYNSNLTARLNSLYDNQNVNQNASVKILNIDPLGDDE